MATNPENNPRPPVQGRSQVAPATGKGHKPLSSADHARSIPSAGVPARHAVRGDGGKFVPKPRSKRP